MSVLKKLGKTRTERASSQRAAESPSLLRPEWAPKGNPNPLAPLKLTDSYEEKLPVVKVAVHSAKVGKGAANVYVKLSIGSGGVKSVKTRAVNPNGDEYSFDDEEHEIRLVPSVEPYMLHMRIYTRKKLGSDVLLGDAVLDLVRSLGMRMPGDVRQNVTATLSDGSEVRFSVEAKSALIFPPMPSANDEVLGNGNTSRLEALEFPQVEVAVYQALGLRLASDESVRLASYAEVSLKTGRKFRSCFKTRTLKGPMPFWCDASTITLQARDDSIRVVVCVRKARSGDLVCEAIIDLSPQDIRRLATRTESAKWFAVSAFDIEPGAVVGLTVKALSDMSMLDRMGSFAPMERPRMTPEQHAAATPSAAELRALAVSLGPRTSSTSSVGSRTPPTMRREAPALSSSNPPLATNSTSLLGTPVNSPMSARASRRAPAPAKPALAADDEFAPKPDDNEEARSILEEALSTRAKADEDRDLITFGQDADLADLSKKHKGMLEEQAKAHKEALEALQRAQTQEREELVKAQQKEKKELEIEQKTHRERTEAHWAKKFASLRSALARAREKAPPKFSYDQASLAALESELAAADGVFEEFNVQEEKEYKVPEPTGGGAPVVQATAFDIEAAADEETARILRELEEELAEPMVECTLCRVELGPQDQQRKLRDRVLCGNCYARVLHQAQQRGVRLSHT